jgi:hypothetical protein
MAEIVALAALGRHEAVCFAEAPLTELYVRLGERAAEDAICRGIESLARAVAMLSHGRPARRGAAAAAAGRLAALAEGLGMVTLGEVARELARASLGPDRHGEAAVRARVLRVASAALTGIWDRDLPAGPG